MTTANYNIVDYGTGRGTFHHTYYPGNFTQQTTSQQMYPPEDTLRKWAAEAQQRKKMTEQNRPSHYEVPASRSQSKGGSKEQRRSRDVYYVSASKTNSNSPSRRSKHSKSSRHTHKHQSPEMYGGTEIRRNRRLTGDTWRDFDNASSPSFLADHRRKGPDADDDENPVHIRDLFPCLGDIFDWCGCEKKKKKRAVVPRAMATGPKVETVCLECNHVIDSKQLPMSMQRDLLDQYDWKNSQNRHPYLHDVAGQYLDQYDQAGKLPEFDGYSKKVGWQYRLPQGFEVRGEREALPQFSLGSARQLNNRPGIHSSADVRNNTFFETDVSGMVAIPTFPTTPSVNSD